MWISTHNISLVQSLLFVTLVLATPTHAEKFRSWFYWFDRPPNHTLSSLISGPCHDALDNYHFALKNGTWHGQGKTDTCYSVQDCLLDNFLESPKANYQAASVVLGLLPQILSGLGPSISEVSLLSTTRPVLSFLISLGAPSVYPSRNFSFDDPRTLLRGRLNKQTIASQSRKRALIFSAVEYIVVLGAIANIFHTAIILGKKTILTWSCRLDWGPLIWGLIPVCIHGFAAVSYNLNARKAIQQPQMVTWWQRELTICANHPRGMKTFLKNREPSTSVIALNCVASLCATFHRWFGTLIFSSLNFISVYDILNYIYWRYMLSTVVCRLILMFELWGMGEEEPEKEPNETAIVKDQEQLEPPTRSYTGLTAITEDEKQFGPPARSCTGMTAREKIRERREAGAAQAL